MSKANLVEAMVASGMSKKEAENAISAVVSGIETCLVGGKDVSLIGFGKFERVAVPERSGRNPQTGQSMTIAAHNKPKFSPGKSLKDKVK
jgi:DNA-binding protein HU-beta